MQDTELLDLRKLKSVAEKLLPSSSLLRKIIVIEPDYIPRSEGLVKIPWFAKMLDEELKSAQ
jgi:hypothetical protein